MEILVIICFVVGAIGVTAFIVSSDKAAIRRDAVSKRLKAVSIQTSYDFIWRVFRYAVVLQKEDGSEMQANCRVSFFLGVIWEDEDSFLKWLVP